MNCRHFQNQLLEYVEGTLPADALAAARRHLAGCHACREAVKREQRIESALSSRLRQSSQTLTLRPEIRRNIVAASRSKDSAPVVTESLVDLCKYWLRLAGIPVATLLIAIIFLAMHFSGTKSRRVSVPVTPRLAAVTSPTILRPAVSVQMSYRLPRHEFHQEENTVVDAVVGETIVINEAIPPGSLENLPQKLEIKTPL